MINLEGILIYNASFPHNSLYYKHIPSKSSSPKLVIEMNTAINSPIVGIIMARYGVEAFVVQTSGTGIVTNPTLASVLETAGVTMTASINTSTNTATIDTGASWNPTCVLYYTNNPNHKVNWE